MSSSLISRIRHLLACFSFCVHLFFPSLIVRFCLLFSSRFRKLFYFSFSSFILSSDPQHLSLALSLFLFVFLSVFSILQVKSTVTMSEINQETKIYLTECVCKKMYFASAGCFDILFISFCKSVYIVYLKKKKKNT